MATTLRVNNYANIPTAAVDMRAGFDAAALHQLAEVGRVKRSGIVYDPVLEAFRIRDEWVPLASLPEQVIPLFEHSVSEDRNVLLSRLQESIELLSIAYPASDTEISTESVLTCYYTGWILSRWVHDSPGFWGFVTDAGGVLPTGCSPAFRLYLPPPPPLTFFGTEFEGASVQAPTERQSRQMQLLQRVDIVIGWSPDGDRPYRLFNIANIDEGGELTQYVAGSSWPSDWTLVTDRSQYSFWTQAIPYLSEGLTIHIRPETPGFRGRVVIYSWYNSEPSLLVEGETIEASEFYNLPLLFARLIDAGSIVRFENNFCEIQTFPNPFPRHLGKGRVAFLFHYLPNCGALPGYCRFVGNGRASDNAQPPVSRGMLISPWRTMSTQSTPTPVVSWSAPEGPREVYEQVRVTAVAQEDDDIGHRRVQVTVELFNGTDMLYTPFLYGVSILGTHPGYVVDPTEPTELQHVQELKRSVSAETMSADLTVDLMAPTSSAVIELESGDTQLVFTNPMASVLHRRILCPIEVYQDGLPFFKGFVVGVRQDVVGRGSYPVYKFQLRCRDYQHVLEITPVMCKLDFGGMSLGSALEWIMTQIIGLSSDDIVISQELYQYEVPASTLYSSVTRPRYGTSMAKVVKDLAELVMGEQLVWGFNAAGQFYAVPIPDRSTIKRHFYYSAQMAQAYGSTFYVREISEDTQFRPGTFANAVYVWSRGASVCKIDYASLYDPMYSQFIGRMIHAHAVYQSALTTNEAILALDTLYRRLHVFKPEVRFTSDFDPMLAPTDVIALVFPNEPWLGAYTYGPSELADVVSQDADGNYVVKHRIVSMETIISSKTSARDEYNLPIPYARYTTTLAWW